MKAFISLLLLCLAITVCAQDNVYTFQATKVNINKSGEKIETSTTEPSVITVNLETETLTIETNSPEIRELLKDQMVMHIDRQMGDLGPQYSLQLDQFTFAHFYLNMGMILFTRNDMHPLQWGIQFLEVQKT